MKTFFHLSDSQTRQNGSALALSQLRNGESALVDNILPACSGLVRRRLLDLGFVPGTRVTCLGKGLFSGPTRYGLRGNTIALREDQASQIFAKPQ